MLIKTGETPKDEFTPTLASVMAHAMENPKAFGNDVVKFLVERDLKGVSLDYPCRVRQSSNSNIFFYYHSQEAGI